MKKNWSLKSALLLMAVLTLGVVSCSDENSDDINEEQNASIAIRMTDAPGDYEAVYVDVQDVMIQVEGGDEEADEDGWMSLDNVETGRYDLLELTGGVSQLLAEAEIPAGYLGQIRLVLGSDNAVVLDGEEDEEPLSTPSAQQSGLKLNVGQDLEAGEDYEFLLDFDVDESIVETGNGGLILKPTIRLSAYENTGMIVGEVHPTNISTLIRAENGSHTISAYADANGEFALHAVPQGTYKVTILTEDDDEIEIDNVEVEADGTVDLETIYTQE